MRLITLNGVKLLVYRNGMILRFSEMNRKYLTKGWSEAKGCISHDGYTIVCLNDKRYKKHRIISYAFIGLDINDMKQQIDHIDRCKTNNNIKNLRVVSHQENQFNKNTKGFSLQDNRYRARIKINKNKIELGYFNTKEEAHQAYLEAKKIYHIIE